MESFATKFRTTRKSAGLSQGAVNMLLQIPIRTIQQWEAGDRTPPEYVQSLVLEKLSHMSINDIMPNLLDLAADLSEKLPAPPTETE